MERLKICDNDDLQSNNLLGNSDNSCSRGLMPYEIVIIFRLRENWKEDQWIFDNTKTELGATPSKRSG